MVETDLSSDLIKAGEVLVRRLDKQGISPSSAFWFLTNAGIWQLVLAESAVGKEGPKALYRQIQRILAEPPNEFGTLSLEDVALMKPSEPLVVTLRNGVRTGSGISGIRFTGNVVNGTLIEDAYIYRST